MRIEKLIMPHASLQAVISTAPFYKIGVQPVAGRCQFWKGASMYGQHGIYCAMGGKNFLGAVAYFYYGAARIHIPHLWISKEHGSGVVAKLLLNYTEECASYTKKTCIAFSVPGSVMPTIPELGFNLMDMGYTPQIFEEVSAPTKMLT